jgi:dTDP-4-amino-4,6-dideoxygalactose transaminase
VAGIILQSDFKRQRAEVEDSVLASIRRVAASGWYILGKEVDRFEKELAAFSGVAAGRTADSGWHLFPVLVNDRSRDEFQAHLHSQGIATGVHYPRIIPDQPALANAGLVNRSTGFENARRFLPLHRSQQGK